ncbi:MAG: peptidylprolyl isomerase, partial [Bacteroidota bacterium]
MIINVSLFAQNTEALIEIKGPEGIKEKVSKDEFLRVYRKNNAGDNDRQKSIQNYLDLFVRFKLKVLEAQRLGYDTLSDFKNEYMQYRDQLAKPYLSDEQRREEMIKNAYDRMNKEVALAHILFEVKFDQASAQDTLDAWNKAMDVRKKIRKGKYGFEEAAVEYSDDPTVKKNQGNLGFVTAFKFPYHFEKTAFNLKQDEISMPVKTQFGYHLIKKKDERQARGQIKIKHILKAVPKNMPQAGKDSIENLVKRIHDSISKDVSFEYMARRYSDDRRTSSQGGELPWFGVGQMIPEFTELAFSLDEDGEVSEPRKTYIGWHILKRVGHRPVPSFDQAKKEIEKAIQKGAQADV